MKKLALIVALLAVVPMANAAIDFMSTNNAVNPIANYFDSATGIFSVSGTINGDTNIGIFSNGSSAINNFALGATMPTDASGYFFKVSDVLTLSDLAADATDGEIWTIGSYSNPYPLTGVLASANISKDATKVYVIETDGDGVLLGQVQAYSVVPEPMTMALLGLGGLFLRKKLA